MKSKRTTDEQSRETTQTELVLNGRAIGIGKNSNGEYVVAMLEFDSLSGESRLLRSIEVGSSKMEAAEKFKVLAVEEGLVV